MKLLSFKQHLLIENIIDVKELLNLFSEYHPVRSGNNKIIFNKNIKELIRLIPVIFTKKGFKQTKADIGEIFKFIKDTEIFSIIKDDNKLVVVTN